MDIKIIDLNKRDGVITHSKTTSIGKAVVETSRWMRHRNRVVGAVGYEMCDHFAIETAQGDRIAEVILL